MSRGAGNRERDISKTLSYWLRHKPEAAGLVLDARGWADVPAVLAALARAFRPPVTAEEVADVVAASDKGRFALNGGRIRAVQGHSFPVDLGLDVSVPPDTLFHGTTHERWRAIHADGLRPMRRQYVHLSPDVPTAERVARRHRGELPLVLRVDSAAAAAAGHPFYRAENGVWLTDTVPPPFLTPV